MGSITQQIVQLPEWLKGRTEISSGTLTLGQAHYRLFIIAVCAALTDGTCNMCSPKPASAAACFTSVDDQRVAAGMGINVNIVFLSTFAFGSGPGRPGQCRWALGAGALPTSRSKFMIYF